MFGQVAVLPCSRGLQGNTDKISEKRGRSTPMELGIRDLYSQRRKTQNICLLLRHGPKKESHNTDVL